MDLATLSDRELEDWIRTVRMTQRDLEEEVRRRFQVKRLGQQPGLAQPERRQGELFG